MTLVLCDNTLCSMVWISRRLKKKVCFHLHFSNLEDENTFKWNVCYPIAESSTSSSATLKSGVIIEKKVVDRVPTAMLMNVKWYFKSKKKLKLNCIKIIAKLSHCNEISSQAPNFRLQAPTVASKILRKRKSVAETKSFHVWKPKTTLKRKTR